MGIKLLDVEKKEIDKINNALKKDPNNADLLTKLGALHFVIFSNEIFKVPDILKKAIKLDAENTEAMFWLAKYFYHYSNASNLPKAEKYLKMALQINPERADCWCLLGMVANQMNLLDLAVDYLKKAVNYSTDWFWPRYNLAKVLFAKGKLLEAKKEIELGLKFTKTIRLRDGMVQKYYNYNVIGNDDEHTRDYKTNNKTDWLDLLKVVNEKIKEEK